MIILTALKVFRIPLPLRRLPDDCLRGKLIAFDDHLQARDRLRVKLASQNAAIVINLLGPAALRR